MKRECYICGKRSVAGRSQKHRRGVAGKRWMYRTTVTPRVFKANLQTITVEVAGKAKRVSLCTRCIKRLKFDEAHNFAGA